MLDDVSKSLCSGFPKELVDECLHCYGELKNHFAAGRYLPNEIEGGKFCEVVYRMLEHITTNKFTPIGKTLDTEKIILTLSNLPRNSYPESIRIHIPRMLRSIYDIRTKRDAAHLADGIDPNLQDSTLVVHTADWILAELIRIYHSVSPDIAQKIIEAIVVRRLPSVQDFNGFLKTLNPDWGPKERIVVTLYQRGSHGATKNELKSWLKPTQQPNCARTLSTLEHKENYIHCDSTRCFITHSGVQHYEVNLAL